MQEYLSAVNWMGILSIKSINLTVGRFCNVLYTVIDVYVPNADVNKNCKGKHKACLKPKRQLEARKRTAVALTKTQTKIPKENF